jgi:hypothetical protein
MNRSRSSVPSDAAGGWWLGGSDMQWRVLGLLVGVGIVVRCG